MKGDTFRVNGFSSPKDPLQKLSWYLTGYLVISFYIFIGTNFSLPKHYLWLIIVVNIYYTILIAIVVYYGYKATKTNVCDDYVNERNEHMNTNYTIETFREKYSNKIVNNELYWCKYCEWYVDKNSKHCRLCNRCTKNFDHHCKWFNNCISHKNYNYFLKCLICINIKLISEIVIILLYIIFEKYDYHSFVSNKLQLILFSFLIVHLVLTMFIFVFLCQLLLFHIYLYFQNMSTYEWILHTRDGKKRKMKMAKEKENETENERKNVSNNNNRVAVANAANDDTAISNIDIQMESRNSKAQSYDSNHHLKGKCDYIWYNIHDIMSNIFTFDKNSENKNETRENNHNRNIYQKNEIQIDVQPKSSSIM